MEAVNNVNNLCERCKYADITRIPRTIREGNIVIKQNGGVNITCTKSEFKSITFTDGMMACTGYEPNNRLDNSISADAVPVSYIKEKIERYSGTGNDLYAAGVLSELVLDWKKEVMRNGEV